MKPRRVYVKVDSSFDTTGYMLPRSITWSDGRVYRIDRVRDFRPAGGELACDCFTVIIAGQEKHLFFERTDPLFTARIGRWFVERPS